MPTTGTVWATEPIPSASVTCHQSFIPLIFTSLPIILIFGLTFFLIGLIVFLFKISWPVAIPVTFAIVHVHIPRYHDRASWTAIVPCTTAKRRSSMCFIAALIPSVASLPSSERLGIKERDLASTAHTAHTELSSQEESAESLGAYSDGHRAKAIRI